MKTLSKIALLLALFSCFNSAFAGNIPENLQVLESSDTSITLDWDDADDVIGYYIYYGTESGSGSSYETEGIDLIDESEFVIVDLLPETRYYIALTSVDEFGTESDHSAEIEHVTLKQGAETQAVNFRVSDVKIIDASSIELIFSIDLDTSDSANREFIIENKESGEEIPVDLSQVLDGQPRNVVLVLGSELDVSTQYKVTVLDISDESGNTIESGIDAFINFTTPGDFTPELESAGPQPEPQAPVVEEETPVVEEEVVSEVEQETTMETAAVGNNAGTSISTNENTLNAAEANEKLPQTGPEHWILAFIALLLAGGIYFISFRKQS